MLSSKIALIIEKTLKTLQNRLQSFGFYIVALLKQKAPYQYGKGLPYLYTAFIYSNLLLCRLS